MLYMAFCGQYLGPFSLSLGKVMLIWMRVLLTMIQRVAAKAIRNYFRKIAEEAACTEAPFYYPEGYVYNE